MWTPMCLALHQTFRQRYAVPVSLTREQLKAVIRIRGAAAQLVDSARAVKGGDFQQLRAIGDQLRPLFEIVQEAVGALEDLDAELAKVVGSSEGEIFWREVEPRGAAFVGWLDGVLNAESLQMRIEAEAQAYAAERVKAERPTGFHPPAGG